MNQENSDQDGRTSPDRSAATSKNEPTTVKKRTFSELVHLESQCKITHYELNNQSLELKDAYLQLTESIEELERFKVEMVD